MGRIVVQQFVSADGFGADSNGAFTLFDDMGGGASREFDEANAEWASAIGAIVLGASTYRMFVEYWPTDASEADPIADRLNAAPKYVLSRNLPAAPWGAYAPATVIAGDAAALVREVADRHGDVVVWGSFDVTDQLFRAGAVDDLRLVVLPVLLGDGVRPVPTDLRRRPVERVASRAFPDGLVELEYALSPR
ncbi:bifunctional deaminase-reductase domain protein [Beutenbergia cavernae DSM 12333]|uniref:Bifunctional deaminase-reductase domain protein n=1 Tax=Beutenbergia cavernae (strain ATCC BAA-8 / DSM 12333 / CCUG 43141 / JCM 11478 / NBRC 16432 / NCIMB 13614 / HKI 0122) TaxID=471853 RepID=C5C4P7_BEUC1|nr:dihydrofolate reductase family protein [Beutenbergia cavernae]ACQ80025.1 bifunctional deaminase-reductase domain protein [Beutenbergia cavernae DSM 12333]